MSSSPGSGHEVAFASTFDEIRVAIRSQVGIVAVLHEDGVVGAVIDDGVVSTSGENRVAVV